jgi:hypothetical protein
MIDNTRRKVDEKSQQLKSIAHLSALIAGFSMVSMVEVSIPEDTSQAVLVMFGGACATCVALMLVAMLNCTLILVGILRFDPLNEPPEAFDEFWRKRCEDDWHLSFKAFTFGVPCFIVNLMLLGWIVFNKSRAAATLVTVIAMMTSFFWIFHIQQKWGSCK